MGQDEFLWIGVRVAWGSENTVDQQESDRNRLHPLQGLEPLAQSAGCFTERARWHSLSKGESPVLGAGLML